MLGDAEPLGKAGQVPYRVDRRLGDTHLAARQYDLAVWLDPALDDPLADFRHIDMCGRDGDRWPHIDTGADLLGEDLADEMPPRVERDDRLGIGPLRMRPDQGRRSGVGQVGAMMRREGAGRHRQGAVDRIGAAIRPDRVAVTGFGGARDHRAALLRGGCALAQLDHSLARVSGMRGQPNVPRDRRFHAVQQKSPAIPKGSDARGRRQAGPPRSPLGDYGEYSGSRWRMIGPALSIGEFGNGRDGHYRGPAPRSA